MLTVCQELDSRFSFLSYKCGQANACYAKGYLLDHFGCGCTQSSVNLCSAVHFKNVMLFWLWSLGLELNALVLMRLKLTPNLLQIKMGNKARESIWTS